MEREAVKSLLSGAGDRAAVVGVRQLRDAVQGFAQPGVPRTRTRRSPTPPRCTSSPALAPSVALHIPWDRVDDYAKLAAHAAELGVRIGAINSNMFQDDDYRLGVADPPGPGGAAQGGRAPRSSASRSCGETGSARPEAVAAGRHELSRARTTCATGRTGWPSRWPRSMRCSDPEQRLLLEYKFFEPYFYAMDVPDWGTSLAALPGAGRAGPGRCWTPGHHAPGTNIEFIVMQLLRHRRLGAFDFNSPLLCRRRSDRGVGRSVPAVPDHERDRRGGRARRRSSGVTFMLDQCHNIEAKIPGQIRSVMNVQEATAKALLVDRGALAEAQRAG